MKRMIVSIVTPESVLVQEDFMMTQTRVEMRPQFPQTTDTGTSKPRATSWFSSKEPGTFHEY